VQFFQQLDGLAGADVGDGHGGFQKHGRAARGLPGNLSAAEAAGWHI
jgi:hypothetical protein